MIVLILRMMTMAIISFGIRMARMAAIIRIEIRLMNIEEN
jgi:hypothetical protein